MSPISIWLGCFIGGMLGVIAGEWINMQLARWRARRLLRQWDL